MNTLTHPTPALARDTWVASWGRKAWAVLTEIGRRHARSELLRTANLCAVSNPALAAQLRAAARHNASAA